MKKEVIERLAALLTAAFGLVAALAWNETIKTAFTQYYGTASTLGALFVYAISVTIIAVVVTLHIAKMTEKANRPRRKKKK